MTPVDLVTIHHEGGGTPSDVPRGADGGYTYWIGATYHTHLRTVWSSYATLNFNGVSLDLCLSGNRMTSAVSNKDIEIIRQAVADARNRGYVTNAPYVRAHCDSPGSATACPGTNTLAPPTWAAIVTACHKEQPPMPPHTPPQFFPALNIVSMTTFNHPSKGKCSMAIDASGHCFADPPDSYMGSPYDDDTGKAKAYWGNRQGATVTAAKTNGYIIEATSGETYGPDFL